MPKRWFFIVCLCLMVVPLSMSLPLQDQLPSAKNEGKALKVTISYQGKGKVDQGHGIFVFLFDSPDFVQNPGSVMPIAFQSIYANDETMTFSSLKAETVYLVAVYDEGGNYTPSAGAPPSGTPVAPYKPWDPQIPTPVKLEDSKAVEIKFSFDDSIRMP